MPTTTERTPPLLPPYPPFTTIPTFSSQTGQSRDLAIQVKDARRNPSANRFLVVIKIETK